MSAQIAPTDAPDVASERMMDLGEAVAADGMPIESPVPHSLGGLASPEASDAASRTGVAADSGADTLSMLTPTSRQKCKGARHRCKHVHAMIV